MNHAYSACSLVLSLTALTSLALATTSEPWAPRAGDSTTPVLADRNSREVESGEETESLQIVFEGTVLQPSGAAAESAVVVSSAGGTATTDALGRFELEAKVPVAAEAVWITAVGKGGANLVASKHVSAPGRAGRVGVGFLGLDRGSSCSPEWLPTFGSEPGTDDSVFALTVYDDGGGPALYAGGHFTTAGGVAARRIAMWDGASWAPLGTGVNSRVEALAVYDDGCGPALIAGGGFAVAYDSGDSHVARWMCATDCGDIGTKLLFRQPELYRLAGGHQRLRLSQHKRGLPGPQGEPGL